MKHFSLLTLIIISLNSCKKISSKEVSVIESSDLVEIYAGPFNQYGPSAEVYSEFGQNSGCKIKIVENNTNGNIFLQVRYNSENQSKDWKSYNEGDFINAQVIYCRATSTSTAGFIKLKIN